MPGSAGEKSSSPESSGGAAKAKTGSAVTSMRSAGTPSATSSERDSSSRTVMADAASQAAFVKSRAGSVRSGPTPTA